VDTVCIYEKLNRLGEKAGITDSVLRNIEEFPLLFPGMELTTNIVFDWSQLFLKKVIWLVLSRNFGMDGLGKGVNYMKT
jgi:hypothetical protein